MMPMLTMFHPEAATAPGPAPTRSSAAAVTAPVVHRAAGARPPGSRPLGSPSADSAVAGSQSMETALAGSGSAAGGLAGGGPVANTSNPFVEVAARLLSETAHDLRSPLTSVRELIRLVYDGDLGATTEIQREMLGEAMGQCDAIASLVDNMLQLDRLRSGLPRTRRRWILPTGIPESVDAAIAGISRTRRVGVQWDGFDGRHSPLFADEELLRRLLVNLICNAMAVSEEGRSVLVRLHPSIADGMASIVVCDQGPGISADALAGLGQRGISGTGGFGLGLAISRTLAALHFARLQVSSAAGEGTQIRFELAAAGPPSVADALVGWRESSLARSAAGEIGSRELRGEGNRRWRTVPFDGPPPRFPESAALLTLRVGRSRSISKSSAELDAIDRVLQADQRLHELVYRTDTCRWVLLWDNSLEETRRRVATVESQLRGVAAEHDLVWSEPIAQPIAGRGNRMRIRELLVRDVLQASSGPVLGDDRSGRTLDPSAASAEVAACRLDQELMRLSHRLARQSDQLQSQADRLAAALQT